MTRHATFGSYPGGAVGTGVEGFQGGGGGNGVGVSVGSGVMVGVGDKVGGGDGVGEGVIGVLVGVLVGVSVSPLNGATVCVRVGTLEGIVEVST